MDDGCQVHLEVFLPLHKGASTSFLLQASSSEGKKLSSSLSRVPSSFLVAVAAQLWQVGNQSPGTPATNTGICRATSVPQVLCLQLPLC